METELRWRQQPTEFTTREETGVVFLLPDKAARAVFNMVVNTHVWTGNRTMTSVWPGLSGSAGTRHPPLPGARGHPARPFQPSFSRRLGRRNGSSTSHFFMKIRECFKKRVLRILNFWTPQMQFGSSCVVVSDVWAAPWRLAEMSLLSGGY